MIAKPLGRLTRQFRMRAPIAKVVSRAFYPNPDDPLGPGTLMTDPSTERDSGLTAPRALTNRALAWIDTQDIHDCADRKRYNPGEARIVAEVLREMRPDPLSLPTVGDEDPLAILTLPVLYPEARY